MGGGTLEKTVDGTANDKEWFSKQVSIQNDACEIARKNIGKNWHSKAKVGQKVLLEKNHAVGRANLQDKFRNDEWVIEQVLDDNCGLYRIRHVGLESKVIHRSNIIPKGLSNCIQTEEVSEVNDVGPSDGEDMPDI